MKGYVVLIGASAGGVDALTRLIPQLPKDFPAPVLIVHHMAANVTGSTLVRALSEAAQLPVSLARDGEAFTNGHVYVAPSDNHLLLSRGKMRVTKGARENRSRPGIDPLFRSAAVECGNRAIGIVLTGYLDDGTAGLRAIQRCGGTCVVQDPDDAAYPDMPSNAMRNVHVEHCVPIASMGALLAQLVARRRGKSPAIPKDIRIEARIAERVLSDLSSVNALGEQVPFNCPNCGGVLWEVTRGDFLRYRCHTGHSFTCEVLLAEQNAKIEETLWIALRMFEERRNLIRTMPSSLQGRNNAPAERAREADVHIQRIRAMLASHTHDEDASGEPVTSTTTQH